LKMYISLRKSLAFNTSILNRLIPAVCAVKHGLIRFNHD
jgi:hypothetical protein